MGEGPQIRILQAGFGAFGPVHLEAWLRLGFGNRLWLADPDPAARARAAAWNLPPSAWSPTFAACSGRSTRSTS